MGAPVQCFNGHINPVGQQYCGQCGSLVAARCLNGHINSPGQQFCGQCGAVIAFAADSTLNFARPNATTRPATTTSSSSPFVTNPYTPARKLDRRRIWTFVVFIAVLLGVLMFVANAASCGRNQLGTGGGSERTGSSTRQSFLYNDWLPALCRPGTFYDGEALHNAAASGTCYSRGGMPILIGQYDSEFRARNDLAMYISGEYALDTTNDGRVILFISPSQTNVLQPLEQFGFEIHAAG